MAFEMKASRFAALDDDVPDITSAKNKGDQPKKKKTGDKKPKSATNSKGTTGNGNKKKTLKSMAFGETGTLAEVKKKPQAKSSKSTEAVSTGSVASTSTFTIPSSSCLDGSGDHNRLEQQQGIRPPPALSKSPRNQPPGMTTAQWQEWQTRDSEFVEGTYESELEAALIQSQLDYQSEQSRRKTEQGPGKAKPKKKPAPVPLNEFNAKLDQPPQAPTVYKHPNHQSMKTKNGLPLNLGNALGLDPDEELVERFRMEAKLEMEREKRLAIERDMLKNRQSQTHFDVQNKYIGGAVNVVENPKLLERDERISDLTIENMELRNELDSCKARLKKVYNIFQEAQELKDKAKLLYQVENLTKLNGDLNEDIKMLHSELEQERSKSHAALNEYRKLVDQTRRRTTTETSQ